MGAAVTRCLLILRENRSDHGVTVWPRFSQLANHEGIDHRGVFLERHRERIRTARLASWGTAQEGRPLRLDASEANTLAARTLVDLANLFALPPHDNLSGTREPAHDPAHSKR